MISSAFDAVIPVVCVALAGLVVRYQGYLTPMPVA